MSVAMNPAKWLSSYDPGPNLYFAFGLHTGADVVGDSRSGSSYTSRYLQSHPPAMAARRSCRDLALQPQPCRLAAAVGGGGGSPVSSPPQARALLKT